MYRKPFGYWFSIGVVIVYTAFTFRFFWSQL
jgi:hypothetical protein